MVWEVVLCQVWAEVVVATVDWGEVPEEVFSEGDLILSAGVLAQGSVHG